VNNKKELLIANNNNSLAQVAMLCFTGTTNDIPATHKLQMV